MVMRTVAVISQKGGVGKTTLATALAVAAEQSGRSAAVFDLDPQASAAFWKDTRAAETPAVVAIPPSRLGHVLKTAGESGCELAIVNAPPFAKDIAFEAAQHADFILIPTRPAVLDVMAMTRTLELVRHYEKPAAVVLTFCPTQGREVSDTEDAVRRLGIPICGVRIHSRIAYSRAQQTGLAAQELEPEGKAAEEIKQLYSYVCMEVYTPRKDANHAGPEELPAGRTRQAGCARAAAPAGRTGADAPAQASARR
jgi:chromosome partitioning protein